MFRRGISSSEVRRVMDEVEREVAAWSAGPAIGIVEVDDGLRKRAATCATWPGATHQVRVASTDREALELAAGRPLALLWVCEHEVDAARVIDAARRRCPIAGVALRTRTSTPHGAPIDAGGLFVPLRSERIIDDFPALARTCLESWSERLARHVHAEIGRRLAERHPAGEVRAAGYDVPQPERSRPKTMHETILDRLLAALRDHDVNVSSAAAELGLGRKVVHAWCRRYGVDLAALRGSSKPPRPRSRP